MSQVGTYVFIKVATKKLVGTTSVGLKSAAAMIEVSNKDSGTDSAFVQGRKNRTIDVSGIASTTPESTLSGYWELWDAQDAGTPVAVTLSNYSDVAGTTLVAADKIISGNALISNLDATFPDNDKNTFSCTLQLTGAVTDGVNAGS